ncbi:MAG: 2-C-methyl-D-erythritol 4-phosphate cytidylyltransferase [Synergistaceae bacterium]|nr:2-C-methyl-D-erythritol 4-phosphate cytidylyltransferase [Synergistaceae bacterium]
MKAKCSSSDYSFIIAAGGHGTRFSERGLKQFMSLNGRPLWVHSVETAHKAGIDEIILVVPKECLNQEYACGVKIKLVAGGSSRPESVMNGLTASSKRFALIHDAARPLVSVDLILRLIANTDDEHGCIPVMPVSDALKRITGSQIESVPRDDLYATQTPQSFNRERLIAALRKNMQVKDEAEAWLSADRELNYVTGERENMKITYPDDLAFAEKLSHEKQQRIIRTGIGYDIHKLIPERKLILGGVLIPESNLGLLGHSDADVLTHAVMDAILGACGLDDIGTIFPATDERFKGADSLELLREVMKLVGNLGYRVEYVDSYVKAQVPRLNKYRDEIKANLGKFFEFNLKFKSGENLDDCGAGLCMEAEAAATVSKASRGRE